MNSDDAAREALDERRDHERRIRHNPWARAADSQLGAWLDTFGARYAGCAVDETGDRVLRWVFPRGSSGAPARRWRELLLCSLGGDRDSWEIVYREAGESRLRGNVRYYASTSTRGDVSQLRSSAAELVDAGLRHLNKPVATCGHAFPDPRLLPGLALAAATALVVLTFLLGWPAELLLLVVPPLLAALAWFLVSAYRVWLGLYT